MRKLTFSLNDESSAFLSNLFWLDDKKWCVFLFMTKWRVQNSNQRIRADSCLNSCKSDDEGDDDEGEEEEAAVSADRCRHSPGADGR